MKTVHFGQVLVFTSIIACCASVPTLAQTIQQLENEVMSNPVSVPAKSALAEAYLKQCELEKSLKVWRQILKIQPGHKRAAFVVSRLTLQALDLDTHLQIIQTLIDKGITGGTDSLLDAAARRAATDTQKARVLYLRGRLEETLNAFGEIAVQFPTKPSFRVWPENIVVRPVQLGRPIPEFPRTQKVPHLVKATMPVKARANFLAALKLYPDTEWGARSAIALAEAERSGKSTAEAERLLRGVSGNEKLTKNVREEANFKLLLIESADWTSRRQIDALRQLSAKLTDAGVKRQVLEQIIRFVVKAQGKWVPEALEAAGAILQADPSYEQATQMLATLSNVAGVSQDPDTLDCLLKVLNEVKLKDRALAHRAGFIRADAIISRAIVENNAAAAGRLLTSAGLAIDKLAAGEITPSDRKGIWELRGRLYLTKAQKLAAMSGSAALPAIMKAREHYISALPAKPDMCLERLGKIGILLEHVREWEVVVALYREVADRFAHMPAGREALLKIAVLYERHLNDPTSALEVYAEYAGRYPAELSYSRLGVGRRLRRLGYSNVLDFQKCTGLTPDGLFGLKTRKKLAEIESGFDVIRLTDKDGGEILRGVFVHPAIFRIARRLERAGRDHDAIKAYLMMLNLFPGKRESDDALLAVARLFRKNMLFEEALGAYAELMEYFPKGNVTSEAYIESARCQENLGRWKKAKELYKLYIKKFPKYKHVRLCRGRIALLEQVQQYQDFLAANPASPKAPEAQYQIASILYKKLKNWTKSAVEFAEVSRRWPKHVRGPDGLFTAGAAHLRAENFPAARKVLSELVGKYPDSRLADDAQYWIGHTYEYSARAVGKLDKRRIVLKGRRGRHRARLLADVALRRRYFRQARPGPELPRDVWTVDSLGVLTSGSVRDRVNADLFSAVGAYRQVVTKFKMGDKAGDALHRIGVIYTKYLKDPEKGFNAYRELLEHYPGTKKAIDALCEVGAYYLKEKRFDEAIKSYRQFVYNYPSDSRVESAMLSIARCYMEKKAWDKALDAYQSYLNKYPRGKQVDFAKAQIAWIRTYYY